MRPIGATFQVWPLEGATVSALGRVSLPFRTGSTSRFRHDALDYIKALASQVKCGPILLLLSLNVKRQKKKNIIQHGTMLTRDYPPPTLTNNMENEALNYYDDSVPKDASIAPWSRTSTSFIAAPQVRLTYKDKRQLRSSPLKQNAAEKLRSDELWKRTGRHIKTYQHGRGADGLWRFNGGTEQKV